MVNSSWRASADGMFKGMRWSYEYSESSMLNDLENFSVVLAFSRTRDGYIPHRS